MNLIKKFKNLNTTDIRNINKLFFIVFKKNLYTISPLGNIICNKYGSLNHLIKDLKADEKYKLLKEASIDLEPFSGNLKINDDCLLMYKKSP